VEELQTVTDVRFTVDLWWQELIGVRVCGGYDTQELVVDA
jgi:hypothetical protein